MLRRNLLIIPVLFILLMPAVSYAQDAQLQWVRDEAKSLNVEQRVALNGLLQSVNEQTTAEVLVMTVSSLNGEGIDRYATRLFNEIGIGKKTTNNGILFLIAPNDRRVRIEVGVGLEELFTDDEAGLILDVHVIPHFREFNMAEGIVEGTEEIARILQQYPEAARGVEGSAPAHVQTPSSDLNNAIWAMFIVAGGLLLMYWLGRRKKYYPPLMLYLALALGVGMVIVVIVAYQAIGKVDGVSIFKIIAAGASVLLGLFMNGHMYRRYRPHHCELCGGPMSLLSEVQDDTHLNKKQLLEEQLKSTDYDVWHCPACLETNTERYVAFLSPFKRCDKCRGQTFKETRTTVVPATYSAGGKDRVDGKCHFCKYKTSRIVRTPQKSNSSGGSSGSSGGSFGGGSSGGGGASRSW